MLRVLLVTMLAQEMRLKTFQQSWEMVRVPQVMHMHDVSVRMRLKVFCQTLDTLRVRLVTKLAGKMRLKFFCQTLETLPVPLVMILARDMRLKLFSTIPGDAICRYSSH